MALLSWGWETLLNCSREMVLVLVLVLAAVLGSCGSDREPMDTTSLVEAVDDLPVLYQGEHDQWETIERHYIVVLGQVVSGECQMEIDVRCAVATLNDEGRPFDQLRVARDGESASADYSRFGDYSCLVDLLPYDEIEDRRDAAAIQRAVGGRDARWFLWLICRQDGGRRAES